MRIVSLVAACFVLTAGPAVADPAPVAPASPTYAQSHLAAASETLHTMMIDSDLLSEISIEASREVRPILQSQITSWPFYNSLSSEKRQAIAAYIDNFPPIAQEETMRGAPEVLESFVPRFAALFSETQLHDINAYMRLPEAQSFSLRAALGGVQSGPAASVEPTARELGAWNYFARTPGGVALVEQMDPFSTMMRGIGYAATSNPRVSSRLRRDFCAILTNQCPAQWRAN